MCGIQLSFQFSSGQSLSRVRLFATPWTTARQASLSIINSCSLPKPMSIESVMPSNHLILCCSLLLLPPTFPSIRVFSNESAPSLRFITMAIYSLSFEMTMQAKKNVAKIHPTPDNIHSDHNKLLKKICTRNKFLCKDLFMQKHKISIFFISQSFLEPTILPRFELLDL